MTSLFHLPPQPQSQGAESIATNSSDDDGRDNDDDDADVETSNEHRQMDDKDTPICLTPPHGFGGFYESGNYADLTLLLPPCTRFRVHRIIMAQRSQFWCRFLQESPDEPVVVMETLSALGVRPEGVHATLYFLYEGTLPSADLDPTDLSTFLFLAEAWEMPALGHVILGAVRAQVDHGGASCALRIVQSLRSGPATLGHSHGLRKAVRLCIDAISSFCTTPRTSQGSPHTPADDTNATTSLLLSASMLTAGEMLRVVERGKREGLAGDDVLSRRVVEYLLSYPADDFVADVPARKRLALTGHVLDVCPDDAIPLLTLAMKARDAALAQKCLLRISMDPELLDWFHTSSQSQYLTGSELFTQTQQQQQGQGQGQGQNHSEESLRALIEQTSSSSNKVSKPPVKRLRNEDESLLESDSQLACEPVPIPPTPPESMPLFPDDDSLEQSLMQFFSQRNNNNNNQGNNIDSPADNATPEENKEQQQSPPEGTIQSLVQRLSRSVQQSSARRRDETDRLLHRVLSSVQGEVSSLRARVSTQHSSLHDTLVERVDGLRTGLSKSERAVEVLKARIAEVQQRTRDEVSTLTAELDEHAAQIMSSTAALDSLSHTTQEQLEHLRQQQEDDILNLKQSVESRLNEMDVAMERVNSQTSAPLQSLMSFLNKEIKTNVAPQSSKKK
eukprot:PhM_4_TR1875/c0_g3_i1/m.58075